MPQQLFLTKAVTGSISGNYNRKGNKINFLSSKVDFPEDSSSFSGIGHEFNTGSPFGYFFGWIGHNDSTLTANLDSLNFSGIGDREILPSDGDGKWSWQILNLTNDSLKVESNRIAIKYYKQ